MQIEYTDAPRLSKIDNLFVLLAEGDTGKSLPLDAALRTVIRKAREKSGFAGKADQGVAILHDQPAKITLIGLGSRDKINRRLARAVLSGVAKIARRNRDARIGIVFPYLLPGSSEEETAAFLLERLAHADYRFQDYKTGEEAEVFSLHGTLVAGPSVDARARKAVLRRARVLADSVKIVRDLGNTPGNDLTPAVLAERAQAVAREAGFSCTVHDLKQIQKLKMGGLLAVNRGSHEEPRFIVLEHAPKKAKKTVCFVGKGITFDSGGISIKPAERMEEMKFDMSGAGAVIGILNAAARLDLPVRVIGLIPSTENLPGGGAYKPGDIIRMMSGKTVEIVNTDAEGRMILADALHYAHRYQPDHLVDFATLTGACVVALAHEATGLFSTDDELAQKLIEAAETAGEPAWRLPVWDEYRDLIRSDWADMKNSGGRWGGAITAALFLKQFVEVGSWAHLDIAGTAYTESENARDPRGATGVGVRTAVRFLESLA